MNTFRKPFELDLNNFNDLTLIFPGIAVQYGASGIGALARQDAASPERPADGFGMHAHLLGNVFLIDALFDLCLDIHPVLLFEHRSPPVWLGLSEGKADPSLRGTFYSGIYSTFNSGDDKSRASLPASSIVDPVLVPGSLIKMVHLGTSSPGGDSLIVGKDRLRDPVHAKLNSPYTNANPEHRFDEFLYRPATTALASAQLADGSGRSLAISESKTFRNHAPGSLAAAGTVSFQQDKMGNPHLDLGKLDMLMRVKQPKALKFVTSAATWLR